MVEFKLVLSNKAGQSLQRECKEPDSKKFIGLKIRDKVKGELIELTGYEFEITGGSDYCGFPMRSDIPGSGRKKILAVKGIGIHNPEKGIKVRKTVCGNTIHARTAQINLKVIKEGKDKIFPEVAAKPAKKEAAKEEKKPVTKEEKKPAEKKPEATAEVKEAHKQAKEEEKPHKPEHKPAEKKAEAEKKETEEEKPKKEHHAKKEEKV